MLHSDDDRQEYLKLQREQREHFGVVDGDFEIYYWDGLITHQITNNSVADYQPSLYKGLVAWDSQVGRNVDVYYNNDFLTSPSSITGVLLLLYQ